MQLIVRSTEGAERRVLSHGGSMMAVEFRVPAGIVAPIHQRPHQPIGLVVVGEIDLVVDGQPTQRLEPGTTCYVPPNVRHDIATHTPAGLFDAFSPLRAAFPDT